MKLRRSMESLDFLPLTSMAVAVQNLHHCMNEVQIWMNQNYLKINVKKTQVMCMANKKTKNLFEPRLIEMLKSRLDIDENQILNEAKLLGVQLDSNLSLKQRVNKICQSGMYAVKVLSSLRNVIDSETKIILVKSLVLNKIDYCNSLLSSIPNYLIEKIQKVLNASIRFIFNLKKSVHITPFMKQAHFLPVQFRIKYKLCCETYKILNNISPKYLHDFLTPDFPKRSGLRSSEDYALVTTTDCEKKSVSSNVQRMEQSSP